MIWVWAKIRRFVIGIGSFLLVLAGVLGYGWFKGRKSGLSSAKAAQAKQRENTVNAIEHRAEVRREVDNEVAAMPEAAPSDHPAPHSAAGKLQSDWSRD